MINNDSDSIKSINQASDYKLIDKIDQKLIELVIKGYSNRKIALEANWPLSTIQRNIIPAPVTAEIDQIIAKLARIGRLDGKLERLAIEMAHKSSNHILGKSPNELSAAYMYLAAILLDVNPLQIDLANLAGITEVAVRNRCNDILTCFKLTITVKPLYLM